MVIKGKLALDGPYSYGNQREIGPRWTMILLLHKICVTDMFSKID